MILLFPDSSFMLAPLNRHLLSPLALLNSSLPFSTLSCSLLVIFCSVLVFPPISGLPCKSLWSNGTCMFYTPSCGMVVLSLSLVALKVWTKDEVCPGHIPLLFSLTLPPVSLWTGPEHFSFRIKLFLLVTKYELNSLFLLKMSSCCKSSTAVMRFEKSWI